MSGKVQSIYEFILSSIGEDGKIPGACDKLPDDATFFSGFSFGFVGGAFEGIMPAGKTTVKKEIRKASKITAVINRFAAKLTPSTKASMCNVLKEQYSTSYLQQVIEEISVPNEKVSDFYQEVKTLVLTSPDRNIVKYGLYLMTLGEIESDKDIVLNLAKHDEFTVHAIRTVLLGFKKPNEIIFDIAKHVDGWGKISAVEYLSPDTNEIKSWLLRYGCANNIMDNYLALICAERGQLLEALQADEIDNPLFLGTGVILKAFIEDTGPAGDIEDYGDGAAVVKLYLSHTDKHIKNDIDGLLTVCAINEMLNRPEFLTDNVMPKGWTKDLVDKYKQICLQIISDQKWAESVWSHVKSDNQVLNWKGREAARKLHIDIWDYIFSKLQAVLDDVNYEKSAYYFELASTDNSERFQKLVDYAEQHLPLKAIASSPAMEMGLGLEYQNHSYLDTMLQSLCNKDGVGIKLIEAGLWSKVIRNRNMALSALETWGIQHYSPLVIERLKSLKKCEPDKAVKQRVVALLKRL